MILKGLANVQDNIKAILLNTDVAGAKSITMTIYKQEYNFQNTIACMTGSSLRGRGRGRGRGQLLLT